MKKLLNCFITTTLCVGTISCGGSKTEQVVVNDIVVVDGGGASATSCTADLGVLSTNDSERIEKMCLLAKLAYIENIQVTLNFDYLDTGENNYVDGWVHTGVDIQSNSENRGTEIGSIVKGKVVGIHDAFGSVSIETIIDNQYVVQVAHMHLENIPSSIFVGAEVEVGTILGNEGRAGLANNAGKHLHLEFRTPCMTPASSLDPSNVDDRTWNYALDPLEYALAISRLQSNINIAGTSFHVNVPETVQAGEENLLSGCVFSNEGLDTYVEFQIEDESNSEVLNEIYNPTLDANNTLLFLETYHFGTEEELSNSGDYNLSIIVRNPLDTSLENSKKYPFKIVANETTETQFSITLPSEKYLDHSNYFDGCVSDQDGISIMRFITTQPDDTVIVEEYNDLTVESCENVENSINFANYYVGSPGRPENGYFQAGEYSIIVEIVDELGNTTSSDTFVYTAISPVASLESPSGPNSGNRLNEFVVRRVTVENLDYIVNIPACLKLDFEGTSCNTSFSFTQNPIDFGLDEASASCIVDMSAGDHDFELYRQCSSLSPRMLLLAGTLNFQ